ncbi:hypothetical protein BT69DRAFT_1347232 [Atractiella rhizophila]|nr:hypothetical protein BT69DRAFT_1347232 [Atractiella rhizophila]
MTEQLKPYFPTFPWDVFPGLQERGRCLHCLNHNLMCTCSMVPVGKDMILESYSIPALPSDATLIQHLARFLALSEHHPSLLRGGSIDFHKFFDDNLSSVLSLFPSNKERVMGLIKSGEKNIYSREEDKMVLKLLRKKRGFRKAGPLELKSETVSAAEKLIEGRWSEMTHFDTLLINNAFQRSSEVYSINEPAFKLVYEVNDIIDHSFDSWAADWHISLETTGEVERKQREEEEKSKI